MVGNEDHELQRLGRSVAETGERAGRIGQVTGSASSADNAITVSVSPGGRLRSVDIRPAVLGRRADDVAAEVMRLAAQATRTANARMHSSLKSVISPSASKSLEDLGMPAGQPVQEQDDDFGGVLQ